MEIRKFTESDREALVALWREAFPDDPPHNEPREVIEAKLKVDDLIFVATDEGRLVGAVMAGYDGHRGWLYAVAVAQSAKRQGIGSKLVQQAVEALGTLGCCKINLQVRSTNSVVVSFYESLGFKVEDRISMGLRR